MLALALDAAFGELPERVHPTTPMAKLARLLEPLARGGGPTAEKVKGALLALTVIGATAALTWLSATLIVALVPPPLHILALAAILKQSFAIRCMDDFVRPIARACVEGDYDRARRLLPLVVRRDPRKLTDEQVVSAVVETVAEGTVDGFTTAVFFYALAGVTGAMAFRAISTLDSLLGYKEPRYANLGWFSAKLDTFVNFIPARLTAALIALAASLTGGDWKGAWETALRDHGKTESLNAGWSMSAMAGALHVKLEKPGHYVLASEFGWPHPNHVFAALRVMKVTSLLFTVSVVVPLLWVRVVLLGCAAL